MGARSLTAGLRGCQRSYAARAMEPRYDDALRSTLTANLARFPRQAHEQEGLRPAAVAVALLPDERGGAAFVLTRRAARLRAHGGQWALPGGRLDEGETPARAALRELSDFSVLRRMAWGRFLGLR